MKVLIEVVEDIISSRKQSLKYKKQELKSMQDNIKEEELIIAELETDILKIKDQNNQME